MDANIGKLGCAHIYYPILSHKVFLKLLGVIWSYLIALFYSFIFFIFAPFNKIEETLIAPLQCPLGIKLKTLEKANKTFCTFAARQNQ